ncbi:efflux RND transporter periplasmic adaptor subunit [Rhodoplanes sp. TEM]|uniref:Efflux RND transporter periplasmic adaptor subunit n=2 Tax=Nitrobacteraceae TaxID=41294 RepID=A0ABT5J907_RHOTP|nr:MULTISPECIES: efflux RND transporter periplasmic adaptor subunit [Rhodoplanes]MDC7786056.1 efflux RND transporter periplasmic adaptor subunit [Rhodoplanes tepidamans]MDC7983803.1 efflux RND transporter periplasmic adaptor subunit [Rhodoplanes sp. TEM]
MHLGIGEARSSAPPAAAAPAAVPVSVAVVARREVALYDEFSGRLEAIERVEVRPRVAGAVQDVHFVEGALVQKGDLLVTIDPAPYAAEVARAEAQVAAAEARLALARSDLERGQQLFGSRTVSQRDLDQRVNAEREAAANLAAAKAGLTTARLNLAWTEVRAPVSGRVGRQDVTVGNLVAAGAAAPVLTTLVSIDPIYASFNADETAVRRALASLAVDGRDDGDAHTAIDRIPVLLDRAAGEPLHGYMQLIDNQVDGRTGTVRVRAVFDNPRGTLMPGQFVRLRMGQPKAEPALLVNERAVGTDQDKRFVLVVGDDNKAAYRVIALGAATDGLRIVTDGLAEGERIVVNGLQRVRPGAVVAPKTVGMDTASWTKGDAVKVSEAQ